MGVTCIAQTVVGIVTIPNHTFPHTHTHTHILVLDLFDITPLWTVFRYHIPLWIVFRYHAPLWIDLIDFDCSIPVPASGWRGDYTSLLLWPHLRAVDGAGRRPGNQTPGTVFAIFAKADIRFSTIRQGSPPKIKGQSEPRRTGSREARSRAGCACGGNSRVGCARWPSAGPRCCSRRRPARRRQRATLAWPGCSSAQLSIRLLAAGS